MPRPANRSRQTLAVLRELLEQPLKWRHGYDLARATDLKSGTLYPLLMRLADQGLLESRWEESEARGLPRRHAYRLTQAGIDFARDEPSPLNAAYLGTVS